MLQLIRIKKQAKIPMQLWFGSVIVLVFISIACMAVFVNIEQVQQMNLANKLAPPSWQHWFGTDHFGRDVAWQLAKGAQNSLLVAVYAVVISLSGGIWLGYWGVCGSNWLRTGIYYGNTLLQVFPALIITIMLATVIGAGISALAVAIGIAGIPTFARLTASNTKSLKQQPYVLAAKSLGQTNFASFTRHILPNCLTILLVQAGIELVMAILAEAALSYLGLGIQPPEVSWGRMLSEAQSRVYQAPQLAIYPGLAIALLSLGIQCINDGWREIHSGTK